jgi:ubiquinone/menaquinone biosynthesis C-methylase UbiE
MISPVKPSAAGTISYLLQEREMAPFSSYLFCVLLWASDQVLSASSENKNSLNSKQQSGTLLEFSGGNVAEIYDSHFGPIVMTPYAKELVARINKKSPPRILELAAGTGRLTRELSNVLPGAFIQSTDLSSEMLEVGRNQIGGNWKIADMQNLPFEPESHDLIISQFGVMLVPDRSKAFSEAHRVLSRGGEYLFMVWSGRDTNQFPSVLTDAMKVCAPEHTAKFDSMVRVASSMGDPESVLVDLKRAGFESATFERVALTFEDVDTLAFGMVHGSPAWAMLEKDEVREWCLRDIKDAVKSVRAEAIIYKAAVGHEKVLPTESHMEL